MIVKQLSVFIENREGRLLKVTEALKNENIDIKTLSLADTSEFGLLRLIVDDSEKARDVLKAAGFSVSLTDVLKIRATYGVGYLHDLLEKMGGDETSIEYMYTLPGDGCTELILKVGGIADVQKKLLESGFINE